MYLFLILKSSLSQYIKVCNMNKDCDIELYCDNSNFCDKCNTITPNYCDSVDDDCCSIDFLYQCKDNPYNCKLDYYENDGDDFLNTFLIFISFFTPSYLFLGIYYNKYVLDKRGVHIIPNSYFWISLSSLVIDGCNFTFNSICHNRNTDNYSSLE